MPRFGRFQTPDLRTAWGRMKTRMQSLSRPAAARYAALPRPARLAIMITGWTVLALFAALVLFWASLTNPRFATPLANWGLHAFGDRSANVEHARLRRFFSTTFDVRGLDWPERARVSRMTLNVNPFGWMPNTPWLHVFAARDGRFVMPPSTGRKSTFRPADIADRIDIRDLDFAFNRRGRMREIHIVYAQGSLAKGTVRAEATGGRSRLTFAGMARSGSDLTGRVTAQGENAADLADVAGLSSPDTPPFKISGDLRVRPRAWSLTDLSGRIGESDVSGETLVELRPERPFIDARLNFASLDFDDLAVVFGLPARADRGEAENEEQRAARAAFERSDRLIPNARIDLDRLSAVDAAFVIEADKVVDAPFGIDQVNLEGGLENRVLEFTQLRVGSGKGSLEAEATINAQEEPARTDVSGRLSGLPIARLFKTRFVRGDLRGTFALKMRGSGFREAFGSADGEVGLWSPNSSVAKIVVEGAGLDIGEALLEWLGGGLEKPDYIPSRCLVANLALKNGEASLAPAIVDNEDSLIQATGGFSLNTERLAISIKTRPKDISLGNLAGDIDIGGTLRRPRIRALDDETIIQAGLTALLSSIAGPLGALPFLETGDGDDAPCSALLAEARTASRNGGPEPSPLDANEVVRPG
jgi:hypothetical protein